MSLFPVFLKLAGRPCLVVGAGNIALSKIESLLHAGAELRVVASQALPPVQALARDGKLRWLQRPFQAGDTAGSFLVIAATDDPAVNHAVYREADASGILCNAVDDPPFCDFYFPSVVRRGALQVAISTEGESPAVAQRLRRQIDAALPQDLGPWLLQMGHLRREVRATHPAVPERTELLHRLAARPLCELEQCPTRQLARQPLDAERAPARSSQDAQPGVVYLVGAGPGHPQLLTLRAVSLLASADLILHDDLVPAAVLQHAHAAAEVVNVGKRCGNKRITQEQIHALMIQAAQRSRSVVRLKSGDPLIFGRAAEEMQALREAQIRYEVVPGITAAFAAAASLGTSLTDRRSASKVIFATGQQATHPRAETAAAAPADAAVWSGKLPDDATLVVYMPGRDYRTLSSNLLQNGVQPDVPCVAVSCAGQPGQQVHAATLATLAELEPAPAPVLLLIGRPLAAALPAGQHLAQLVDVLARPPLQELPAARDLA